MSENENAFVQPERFLLTHDGVHDEYLKFASYKKSRNVSVKKRGALWYSFFGVYGNGTVEYFPPSLIVHKSCTFAFTMVKLHLKQGDESLFLFETTCQAELSELIPQLVRIQNGRLKIERLFYGKPAVEI